MGILKKMWVNVYPYETIHFRFEVKTVTDVVSNMENGIKHVIQVPIYLERK